MKNTAIVVLTWNDWKNTIDCLQSIANLNYKNFDVILVDNNSKPQHIQNIKKWHQNKQSPNYKFVKKSNFKLNEWICVNEKDFKLKNSTTKKRIFFIKNKKNFGLTKGLNIGYNFAIRNRYYQIFRVDNDICLDKNSLKILSKTLNKNNTLAVSPKILHAYLPITIWWHEFYLTWSFLKFQKTMNLKKKRIYNSSMIKGIKKVHAICGCCSLYKTTAFKKAGLGDEEFFYGPEDIELSFRISKFGTLKVNKDAVATHKIAKSEKLSGIENRTKNSCFGFLLLIKKIGTPMDKLFGYTFFILRYFFYIFLNKNKIFINAYKQALINFFIKRT